jgi:multisubunit Na+/H+ antiporter MnhC subunit
MTSDIAQLIRVLVVIIPLLLIAGFYCIIVTRNLIRTLIGLEILTKAVTLLIIVAGYVTGHAALAQSFAITLIIIEVVVLAVAAGIIVNVVGHTDSLDARNLQNLRG